MPALAGRKCLAGEEGREGFFAVDGGLLPVLRHDDAKLRQERERVLAVHEAQCTLNICYWQNWPVSTTDQRQGLGQTENAPASYAPPYATSFMLHTHLWKLSGQQV